MRDAPHKRGILSQIAKLMVIILLNGCSHRANQDASAMDTIFANTPVDNVEFGSLYETNHLAGEKVRAFVAAFNQTNRLAARHDGRGSIEQWISFKSGSNYVLIVNIFENGVFQKGAYCFNLKQPLPSP